MASRRNWSDCIVGERGVRSFVCHCITGWSLAAVVRLGICVPALSFIILTAITPASAKTPGETHCYKKICHRVKTIAETRRWIGKTIKITATHYDHPSVDRYNTGKYTSSGEVFNANDPTRASSSNLPDGTELLAWNPVNGRAVHVRINDFGPFHSNRKLDLTRAAAEELGFARAGVADLDVIIVAAPPNGAPRYKRGRRYPAALGYLGILRQNHIDALVNRIRLGQQLNRTASIDIQKFLWTTKIKELGAGTAVAGYSPPVDDDISEYREAIGILPYAKASADPRLPPPPRLAELVDAPQPVATPVYLQAASTSDAVPVKASIRPASPHHEGPARFGLPLSVAEEAGWRGPPSILVSQNANRVNQSKPERVAALMKAPIWRPSATGYEVATANVDSIRWSIPGLDTFMRAMAPVWGFEVSPLHALQAAAAMIIAVTMMTSAALQQAYLELRRRPRPIPMLVSTLLARAMRHVRTPPRPRARVRVIRREPRRLPAAPERLLIRTKPHASVIARGLRVDGGVESRGTVIVSGTVYGVCRCHTLVIQAEGRVEGDIEAVRVEIRGRFKGEVSAASLIIEAGAEIDNDITLNTIAHKPFAGPAQRPYAIAAE